MLIRIFHHTFRLTRWTGIVLLVGVALTLSLIRFWILPQIDHFRHHLEATLSRQLQRPVHIQKLRASLYHLTPQLRLLGTTIGDPHQHQLWMKELQVTVNLPASLSERQLRIDSIRLVGAEIHVEKTPEGDWIIHGLGGGHEGIPSWLLRDGHFELLDSTVHWHLNQKMTAGNSTSWHNLRIQLVNRGHQHHLLFSFHGGVRWTKQAWLHLSFQGDPRHPFHGSGRFHLSLQYFHLPTLQRILTPFLPHQPLRFAYGHGWLEAVGQWQQSELESRIAVALKQARVEHPDLKSPFWIHNLNSSLGLHLSARDWQMKTTYLRIQGKGLDFSGRISMDKTAGQPPNLEAFGMISELQLAQLCTALQTKQPSALNHWLTPLPLQGKISGHLLWRGKLADYPFSHGEGIAEAQLRGQNLTIRFLPEWPALKQADVRLTLLNDEIQLHLTRSGFANAQVGPATGTLQLSVPDPILSIKAQAHANLAQVLSALNRSPLKAEIQKLTDQVDLAGRGHLDLRVDIPLLHAFDTQVQGKAVLQRSTISLRPIPLTLTGVKGNLAFDRERIETRLTGQFREHPARLVASADGKMTDVHLETRLEASQLPDSIPFHQSLEGETDMTVELVQQGNRPAKLTIQSDLKGVSLQLPAPLGKPLTSIHPFTLTAWLQDSEDIPLTVDYPPIHAAVFLDPQRGSLRGRVGINEPPPPLNRNLRQGIIVQGSLPQLDLPAWLHALPGLNVAQNHLTLIHNLDFKVDHLLDEGRDLGNYRVTAQANGDRWDGHLDTPFGSGIWRYTNQPGRLDLTFSRLDTGVLAEKASPSLPAREPGRVSFEHWPAIHFNAHQVLFASRNIGHIELHAIPDHSTLLFDLKLTDPTHHLEASGKWLTQPQIQTQIQGHFSSPALGEFLVKINHPTALAETPARADFALNWPASPQQFSLRRLNGHLELDLGAGRWLDVEPGAGRLFGLLYLGTLQRRLRLDFSDLFSSGLSYDHISGHISITNGKAYTDDLIIEAVAARIFISGRVDLVEQRTDELVTVVPNTPLTLGIVGQDQNTQVGKAAGLLQRLINSPLDSITQSQYAITGTWDQPVIIRLRRSVPGTILNGIWSGLKIITGNHDAP